MPIPNGISILQSNHNDKIALLKNTELVNHLIVFAKSLTLDAVHRKCLRSVSIVFAANNKNTPYLTPTSQLAKLNLL